MFDHVGGGPPVRRGSVPSVQCGGGFLAVFVPGIFKVPVVDVIVVHFKLKVGRPNKITGGFVTVKKSFY
jgi:hypothetical protein